MIEIPALLLVAACYFGFLAGRGYERGKHQQISGISATNHAQASKSAE